MEQQFYIVTGFYQAQRLTVNVDQFKIMAIMNCDKETVFTTNLRTSDFCYYMGIDEMLIQVFLASLYTFNEPLPPVKTWG